jgi:ATP-dependent Clp protease ATP-binding subunit ClpC
MFERFTAESRRVVVLAQEWARELKHAHIGTEHLLLALVVLDKSPASSVLEGFGMTRESTRAAVLELVPQGEKSLRGHIPFTPRAKKVLELSLREALAREDDHISPEHVLLGILAEGEGVATQVLRRDGRALEDVRATVIAAMGPGGRGAKPSPPGGRTPAAEQVLALAEKLAAGAPVGSHHMLEALAAVDSGMAGRALAALGITSDALAVQFEAVDLYRTSDATPEQAAAATMSLSVDADKIVLTSTDPELVGKVRGLVEQAEGPLTGDGVLAGSFIALHATLDAVVASIDAVLNPQPPALGEPGPPTSMLERLRRMRRSG